MVAFREKPEIHSDVIKKVLRWVVWFARASEFSHRHWRAVANLGVGLGYFIFSEYDVCENIVFLWFLHDETCLADSPPRSCFPVLDASGSFVTYSHVLFP